MPAASGARATKTYYLALGDSVPVWDGSHSYPHLLVTTLAGRGTRLTLADLAVSEATTSSMRDDGQYQAALAFLGAHAGHMALITVDIGGNDIVHCATPTGIDPACVHAGMATVQSNLTAMLSGLQAAAPSVPIIGMTYYDPYLGDWLAGGATRALALGSLPVVAGLNAELTSLYGGAAHTADVAGAFRTMTDTGRVSSSWGRVPVDVQRACTWLWISCHRGRAEGFADDPNVAGQKIIAAAFARTIGTVSAPGKVSAP
jgi:hypothetical protein